MHHFLNRTVIIIVVSLVTNSIIGKQWPVKKGDDPQYWNWFNCSFCEIHETGKPHFHCGIDIDVNKSNCPVRAVESGRIYEIGNSTLGLEIEYPEKSGKYNRRIRYLHLKGKKLKKYNIGDKINKGDVISVVQESKAGWSGHLHIEFYQNYSNKWVALNPIRNLENWTLDAPEDNYDPEINDIYFEFLPGKSNDASGAKIIKNSGSISIRNSYIKIHSKNRTGSVGQVYNSSNDLFSVYGNVAPVVFARDAGTNCIVSSGEGLTVYKLSYYLNDIKKYQIEFDKLSYEDRFEIGKIFRTDFNTRKSDQFNGNNDYIKLYDIDETRIDPQKQINGKYPNGVWCTKCNKKSAGVSVISEIKEAYSIEEAFYPDGIHNVAFETEDAAGKTDKVSLKVIVDNFLPYVKQLEMYTTHGKNKEPFYSASWDWNPASKSFQCKVKKNDGIQSKSGDILLIITSSEPMTNINLEIKLNQVFSKNNSSAQINSNNTEFHFKIPKKYFSKSINGMVPIEITGSDIAKNELFGFSNTNTVNYIQIPARNKQSEWNPIDYNKTDLSHHILFK